MLRKLLILLSIFFAGLILISTSIYLYIKNNDVSQELKVFILKQINQRLEGKLNLNDFDIDYLDGDLIFAAEDIQLTDKDNEAVCELAEVVIKFSPESLLKFKLDFDSIEANSFELFLIKGVDGKWNLSKILKTGNKKTQLPSINYLNIEKINVDVKDKIQDNHIQYNDLQIKLQREKDKKKFLINLSPQEDFNGEAEQSQIQETQIILNGLINFNKDFYEDKDFYLNTEFLKLPLSHLEFFLSALAGQEFANKIKAKVQEFNAEETLLNGEIKVNREEDHLRLHMNQELEKFSRTNSLKIQTNLSIDENIEISNLALNIDGEEIRLDGDIEKWQNKNRKVDLNIKFEDIQLAGIVNRKLDFIKNRSLNKIINKISLINKTNLVSTSINYQSSLGENNVKILAPLYENGRPGNKNISAHLKFNEEEVNLLNLNIPYRSAEFNTEGKYNKKTKQYQVTLHSKDLPMELLKIFLSDYSNHPQYGKYIANTIVKGHTNLDLKVTNSSMLGTCKIANGYFSALNYPIKITKFNTDFEIKNKEYIINKLNGYLDEKYISGQGEFRLDDPEKPYVNFMFLADEIDLKNIGDQKFLQNFQFKALVPEKVQGLLSNIQVHVSSDENRNYMLEGNFNIDDVSLKMDESLPEIKNIHGEAILSGDLITIKQLNAKINQGEVSTKLIVNNNKEIQDIDLTATNINLDDINKFIVYRYDSFKDKLLELGGTTNAHLVYNPEQFSVDAELNSIRLRTNLNKFKQKIDSINGSIHYENKDLLLKDLNIKYLNSDFVLNGDLLNTSNEKFDPLVNLNLEGNLHSNLIKNYIPSSILNFLKFEGLVKSKISVNGNKNKQVIDSKIFLNELDYFNFGNWLLIDKSMISKIRTKIIATPNLIISDDTKVVFRKEADKIKLRGSYQVKDWKERDKITYEIFVKSEAETAEKQNLINLVAAQISSLKPFNLNLSNRNFLCDTYGSIRKRLSLCKFDIGPAMSKGFGIGDLISDSTKIDLVSISREPLEIQFQMDSGDWNGLAYKNLNFDLAIDDKYSYIKNLKTEVMDGKGEADIKFDYHNLDSEFDITGYNLPAHEIAESVWQLGSEIPQGLLDIDFKGKTKGIMLEDIFFNLEGDAQIAIKKGKLSQLKSMQKLLTAINTVKSFDVNNVVQTLITLEGGKFDHLLASLNYDHGKVSTDKALLKASKIELIGDGYIDYAKDYQSVSGKGMIPKYSDSLLGKLGVGGANLGNLASLVNLNVGKKKKEKRFFKFKAEAVASDSDAIAQSIKENFMWLEESN